MADQIFDLRIRNLSVFGSDGRAIVSIPRLETPAGCALGIQGPSGAGKSTLLAALAGLVDASEGEVLWGATNILGLRDADRTTFRSRNIGMIFQDFLLFDELGPMGNTAIQAMFLPRRDRAKLRNTAQSLLVHLDLPTEERSVAQFSGGERQRVALARALAHDPMIVLADEPTANLHRDAADALTEDLLARMRDRGCSLITISHDERLLDRMDRVITIEDGAMTYGMQA